MDKVIKLVNIKRALNINKLDSGSRYLVGGRVQNFRAYKSKNFIDLVDGSTNKHLQIIIGRDLLKKPELGSYLTCKGSLVPSKGQQQNVEFKVDELISASGCDPNSYPLATVNEEVTDDWYRRHAYLRPRVPQFGSLLRVKSELEMSLHMIMRQMDFIRVHTPILTSNDSEASSDLFLAKRSKLNQTTNNTQTSTERLSPDAEDESRIPNPGGVKRVVRDDYFTRDVYLTTSAQLHLEILASSLSRVYTLSNTFRAENSLSTRHLCEFLMFEAEEANVSQLEPLMDRVESIIKFVGQYLSEVSDFRDDLEILLKTRSTAGKSTQDSQDGMSVFEKMTRKAYIRMDYQEAQRILRAKGEQGIEFGQDISRAQENKLLEHCDNLPIFITGYPKQLKPFYMKCDPEDRTALCFDLIAPIGGEICGGSLREESCEKLCSNLEALRHHHGFRENSAADFNWYLDSRRFGTFPHGGFGIGIERLLQSFLGIRNIKDTSAFPRWAGHCPM